MSDASVGAIRLPGIRGRWRSEGIARKIVLGILSRLSRGTLTLHVGDETLHFGRQGGGYVDAVINVHDGAAYQAVLSGGVIGAGESYMQGHWSSPHLVDVIRLFSANMATMDTMDRKASWTRRAGLAMLRLFNGNSLSGSRKNIGAHYDLGNDFFSLFLDPTMMYSSAVFDSPGMTLEEASLRKLELLCEQVELCASDHLLEIGTGWGGMAIFAAQRYGCRVTTTTISREQYEFARDHVARLGLQDRVTVLCEDYRKLQGSFDKLVSIEMIEAVGHEYYREYFSRCSNLLKPGGKLAIQAITVPDQRYRDTRDSVDFIKRYIFPGGCLPSLEVISAHLAKHTDMQMTHLRDITQDYARTLEAWRGRFMAALDDVRDQGFDDVFLRMWEFYLAYCEGGFRERIIGTVQFTCVKPDYRPAE